MALESRKLWALDASNVGGNLEQLLKTGERQGRARLVLLVHTCRTMVRLLSAVELLLVVHEVLMLPPAKIALLDAARLVRGAPTTVVVGTGRFLLPTCSSAVSSRPFFVEMLEKMTRRGLRLRRRWWQVVMVRSRRAGHRRSGGTGQLSV